MTTKKLITMRITSYILDELNKFCSDNNNTRTSVIENAIQQYIKTKS